MLRNTAALNYEERQTERYKRIVRWQAKAQADVVSKWNAFRACCQIRKQILWAWVSHLFEKNLGK